VDTEPLGLDRFDEQGRSRLATDPIALPFPAHAPQAAAPAPPAQPAQPAPPAQPAIS
jgi:hypothetical protein